HTFTREFASAVPLMMKEGEPTTTAPDGLVTVGAAGAMESSVMVGTSTAPERLTVRVAVTTKLLSALASAVPCVRLTGIEYVVAPPVSCSEPTTASLPSITPSLLASDHTCTSELAVAVPV